MEILFTDLKGQSSEMRVNAYSSQQLGNMIDGTKDGTKANELVFKPVTLPQGRQFQKAFQRISFFVWQVTL